MIANDADGRRTALLGGLGVAAVAMAVMLATASSMAIAWDEAYTLNRLERVRTWFQAMADPAAVAATWNENPLRKARDPALRAPVASEIDTRGELLRPEVVRWFWPFAREEPDGHPPFYAIVALLGDVVAPDWPPLARARIGTMLAVSLAAGAIFSFLASRRGIWPGLVGAGAWILHPQVFALGHYATYDALLSSLWVGAILAFARAVEPDGPGAPPRGLPRWGWSIAFGVLLGWAMGTKLTGWLIPIPLIAWSALYLDRRGLWTLVFGGAAAAVTLDLFTPPFWTNPVMGLERFFASNLGRAETIPIKVQFLGHIYNTPRESLPPYNTLVLTAIVTPAGFLLLSMAGALRSLGRFRADRFGVLVLANWLFLLALRALPGAPGHDGVRQFLPAFGCLALMAGLGAEWAVARLGRWARPLLAAALIEGASSVAVMMPVPLSYYSPIVGGLPGARALGMEPTFYWDAMTDEALARLDERVKPGEVVMFLANPIAFFYKQTGRLEAGLYPADGDRIGWYVVQNRPGTIDPTLRRVVARLGDDPRYVLSSKLGVPLVWSFPASEVERR